MARGRRLKQENAGMDAEVELPQPSELQQLSTSDIPLRSGSQPASVAMAASSSNTVDSRVADGDADTTMTEAPTDEAMQALGGGSRELIRVIEKLESLNIHTALPSLPLFVVIGDQSAGKSSIIEAACDISLPRESGTCTRCPFHITTTASRNGEPWSCSISLHIDFAYMRGRPAGEGSTFEHWLDQDRIIRHFVTVHSKADLDHALRCAQLAILNPQKNPLDYVGLPLNAPAAKSLHVGFSPNIISLKIEAPGLPELAFYDLPGAISTVADYSQQHLVYFIEALLKSYLAKEKAYILVACPADQDMEVSTAFGYLRAVDAVPRSMGIQTKPDLVDLDDPGKIEKFRGFLSGNTDWKTGAGWFVTRQLSQKEMNRGGVTHSQARKIEAEFFARGPWATELAEFSHRFGIPNLAGTISQMITKHILNDLPEIVQRVQDRLEAVKSELASFPEPAIAPQLTVINEIARLKAAIDSEIGADSHMSTFLDPYRQIYKLFTKNLKNGKPTVILVTPGWQKPSIQLSSDEEESQETPSKSQRMNNGASRFTTPRSKSVQKVVRRTPARPSDDSESPTQIVFSLDKLKRDLDSAPGADLPGQVSDVVVNKWTKSTVQGWSAIVDGIVSKIDALFRDMLHSTSSTTLVQYHNTEFLRQVKEITHRLMDDLMADVTTWVRTFVASETHRPYTKNEALMQLKQSDFEAALRKRRNEDRVSEYYDEMEANNCKVPSKPEQKKKALDLDFIKSKLPADHYDREVKCLATPLAYYSIASGALVDVIAKHFEYGLLSKFQERLHGRLVEDLRVADQEYCAQLLAEDPQTERRRAELNTEKSKLQQAVVELNSLPRVYA